MGSSSRLKVLVIGGTGNISTPMTRQLLELGHEVVHYNRAKTALALPDGLPKPRVIVGDRKDLPMFERQLADSGTWDAVVDMCLYEPEEAESVVRALAGRAGQYVFCSTVDAYVKPFGPVPITERSPVGGLTVYGKKKAVCERLFFAAHERGAFPVTVIRPAMSYGPGRPLLDTFGWNSHFMDRIYKGLPLISHGDGQALWGAAHVEDVSRAFTNAVGNERAKGRAYHTTSDEWFTWDRYYAAIARGMDRPCPELVHIPTDFLYRAMPKRARECLQNFQFTSIYDNTAARRDLDFRPSIRLVDGAREVWRSLLDGGKVQKAEDAPHYDRIIRTWKDLSAAAAATLSAYDAP